MQNRSIGSSKENLSSLPFRSAMRSPARFCILKMSVHLWTRSTGETERTSAVSNGRPLMKMRKKSLQLERASSRRRSDAKTSAWLWEKSRASTRWQTSSWRNSPPRTNSRKSKSKKSPRSSSTSSWYIVSARPRKNDHVRTLYIIYTQTWPLLTQADMWVLMLVVQQSKMDNTEYRRVGHRRSLSQNKMVKRQSSERYVVKTKNFKIDCNAKDTLQQLKKLKIKAGIPYLQLNHKRAESRAGSSFKSLNKPTPVKPQSKQQKEEDQRKRVEQLKRKAEAETSLAKRRKSIETRRRKDEIKQMQKQIQQQHEQRIKLRTINLKRQKTAVSLIFQDHKESINMMKRSRLNRTKSQQSLADQSLRETTKNFQYTSEKKKLEGQRLKYEIQYHKAFLRNQPKPKQDVPDPVFYQTLREKSKKLTRLYGGGVTISSNSKVKGMTSQLKTQKEMQLDLGKQMKITSIRPVVFQPVSLMNPKANRKDKNPQQLEMNQCIKQSIQVKLQPTAPTKPQTPLLPSNNIQSNQSSPPLQNIQTPLMLPAQPIQVPPILSS